MRERLLEPLGMRDSACRMTQDHPLRARACSLYAGSPGAWTREWSPADEPLFPIFLGSQGLYSTAADYARFLRLYLDRGRAGGARLLRHSSVRPTLEPGPWPLPWPTGFPGLRADYGTLMQLWTRPAAVAEDGAQDGAEAAADAQDAEREVLVFGHAGSDGTHAWAFPDQDALVLYFTQSRGTTTGWRVEERLAELFLGVPFDPLQAELPLEQFLGYYAEDEGDLYRAVVRDGDGLALEVVGRAVAPLDYVGEERWKARPEPSTVLAFDRDPSGPRDRPPHRRPPGAALHPAPRPARRRRRCRAHRRGTPPRAPRGRGRRAPPRPPRDPEPRPARRDHPLARLAEPLAHRRAGGRGPRPPGLRRHDPAPSHRRPPGRSPGGRHRPAPAPARPLPALRRPARRRHLDRDPGAADRRCPHPARARRRHLGPRPNAPHRPPDRPRRRQSAR